MAVAAIEKANDVRKKFKAACNSMNKALIERSEEIKLCLTGLVAQEHVLLVGPPGTAKSLLLDSLVQFCGGKKFVTLLNRYTAPEELFGPISLKSLKEDSYRRVVAGKMPEADFVYLDEIFKASSSILNTTLRILNERVFDYGDGSLKSCPLKLCVASSNEWPGNDDTGKELTALFDRFLLRKTVNPIASPTGRRKLLWGDSHKPVFDEILEEGELQLASEAVEAMTWSEQARESMEELLGKLASEGIRVGDRRQFKVVKVAKAYAWLEGADEVMPDHLEVCQHILWDDAAEQASKVRTIVLKMCNPTGSAAKSLLSEAEEIVGKVNIKEISEVAVACTKLSEIKKKLTAMKDEPAVVAAREKVSKMSKTLRDQAVSSED